MFKLITLLKRRPGMTMDEFVAYYEASHRVIGEKYLRGHAVRYVRRFLYPLPDADGVTHEPDHDVIMEIWFPDKATFETCMGRIALPDAMAEIIADEEKLFDRPKLRSFTVDERESDMSV